MITVRAFRVWEEAVLPQYSTAESACFDISACLVDDERILMVDRFNAQMGRSRVEDGQITIFPNTRTLIPTGLIFDIPQGWSLRLHPRSGLAFKKGIMLANCEGIVDSDYFHQTFVAIYNTAEQQFVVRHGDRIAQGELVRVDKVVFELTDQAPQPRSERAGGFGSTGIDLETSP